MLRMQNGIYEKGKCSSTDRQLQEPVQEQGPRAGRLPGHHLLFSQTKVSETSRLCL